jgi:hypothetical protein
MLRRATLIVLNRRYVLKNPNDVHIEARGDLQKLALVRARAAATQTNAILEKIIIHDMVNLMKPMTCVSQPRLPWALKLTSRRITAIIPAMQIHLLDCKSSVSLTRRLGNHKLQLCMIVLSELQDTYWGAIFTLKMFRHAQSKLCARFEKDSRPSRHEDGDRIAIAQPREMQTLQFQPHNNFLSTTNVDDLLNFDFALADMPYSIWCTDILPKYVEPPD